MFCFWAGVCRQALWTEQEIVSEQSEGYGVYAGSAEQFGAPGSGCAVRMHGGGQGGVSDPSEVITLSVWF